MSSSDAILLVGGAGFIGRALAKRLAALGWEVHVLSRKLATGLPPGVIAHQGDQGDACVVTPLLARCTKVYHLAAATVPADTVWCPTLEAEATLLPALRFLECAQGFPQNHYFLMSSGGALYGNTELATEHSPLVPASYHGAGKLALEGFFGVLEQRYPGCLTIIRPSNIYGPGQALRHGFGVIRTLLERARDGGRVTIFGEGSAIRDFLYIDDLVAACLSALSGTAGIYNIGAGKGTSLNELLTVIESVTRRRLDIERQPVRPSDVARVELNIDRARSQLNWEPVVGLEEGVGRTWEYLQ